MVINEVHDERAWDGFLLSRPTQLGIFLQSWQWGEFQARLGRKVWRLGITRTDTNRKTNSHELVGVCMVVKYDLPMGKSYLYAPRGPVFADESGIMNQESWDCFIDYVRRIAQKEGAVFLRIEPIQKSQVTSYKLQVTRPIQPKQTLALDLAKSKDELLAAMHDKTRYNIRLALRKGIMSHESGIMEFGAFWKLMQETAKRDKFQTHPREYYETIFRVLGDPSQPSPDPTAVGSPSPLGRGEGEGQSRGVMRVRLHAAYYENTMIAAAMVGYFGDTATYLHGASDYAHRALMGPHALHWEIINDAKKDGYLYYDFWGVKTRNKEQVTSNNWAGITRFKMGFGGEIVNYPGTFDLPLRKFWYKFYRLGRKAFP